MIEHKLKLKFDDSFNGILFSTQGDTGRVFEIEVRDELDNAIDISGHKLEFYVGNDSKVIKVEASISGNKFIVKPVNEQFTKAGLNKAQFVLYDAQGLQVGSQIFDLHVEESIQNGATVGANVLVDFSKIQEAIKLIKGYEKTFEESKNLDTTLSSHIDEGRKVNQELVSNTSAGKGLNENLKTSTTKASETYTKLEASRTGADTLNNDIKTNIASGNKTNANLQASISTAKNTQSTLQEKTAQGIDANTKLGQSIKTGQDVVSKINTADKNLATSVGNAETAKTNLDASISKAETAKTNLDASISKAEATKTNLDASIDKANTTKTGLDTSTQAGNATESKLKDTDTKAGTSISTLQDLLNKSAITEQSLKEIIASGNLDKYITEPKLQEALAKIKTLKKEVVDTLPSTGQDDVIYLVKDAKGKANNVYLEYLWINNAFELIGSTEVDLSGYAKTKDLKYYAKKSDIRPEAKFKTMTAVIDQANSNPLTCVTYEDDARLMEKGSKAWDEFFGAKLVLFKDGKEVRDLKDSELSSLTEADGDVMVKFKRMGLRINTVGDKVYVSMTDNPNSPDFKYYAHSRGDAARDAFYLGAYLGYNQDGKLRSVTGKKPKENSHITNYRTLAQANGKGYDLCGFYQLTFLQAAYVLKYGNLDSQTALGQGLVNGGQSATNTTGATNGKGVDFGSTSSNEQMRFQYIEDFWGNRFWAIDGVATDSNCTIFTATDNFNNSRNGYLNSGIKGPNNNGGLKKVFGTSELGFLGKEFSGSTSTYYADYAATRSNYFLFFGGYASDGSTAGAFRCDLYAGASEAYWSLGARLMFIWFLNKH